MTRGRGVIRTFREKAFLIFCNIYIINDIKVIDPCTTISVTKGIIRHLDSSSTEDEKEELETIY